MNEPHIPENNEPENNEVKLQQEKSAQELTQAKERLAYLMAEFDNYKRRTEKERIAWMDMARKDIIIDFLSLVDDLERAASFEGQSLESDEKTLKNGVDLMYKSLQKTLEKYKVEEIPFQKNFDPEQHEAIMTVEVPDHASGEVVAVLQKGFKYKGAVLRPAKVSVAQ